MRWACALAIVALLCGCERSFRDMYDQPRYKPLAASTLWPDGRASRPTAEGAIAYSAGTFAGSTSGRMGPAAALPERFAMPAPTPELLARGRDRFDIFCAPCHGVTGDGDGMIVRRGFPRPPSFHTDALRAASDADIYAVITNGYGVMYSHATRLEPADRIAIVAYLRALQLSQHATLGAVPDEARRRLEGTAR